MSVTNQKVCIESDREWKCHDPQTRAAYTASTAEALRCLEGKWKIAILCQLFSRDALRFSELERSIEGVTQKMLIQQLKELASDGVVRREAYPEVPPRVEYSLTGIGRGLAPAFIALMDWAVTRRKESIDVVHSSELENGTTPNL